MQLLKHLRDLYTQVAGAAPNALIVVTGYPYLFEPPAEGDLNADIINAVNSATALNCTIQQAVADAQAAGIDIVYVDVTAEFEVTVWQQKALHQRRRRRRLPPECHGLPCLCQGHLRRNTERRVGRQQQVA